MVALLAAALWIAACSAPPQLLTVAPTQAPSTPTALPPTEPPAPTEAPSLPDTPDPAIGQALWPQKPCSGCHGAGAEGDFGPKLAGTELTDEQVLQTVRNGKGAMPTFDTDQISDLEVQHIYAWLRSLAPPTPTPTEPPPTATPTATAAEATATLAPDEPTHTPAPTPTAIPTATLSPTPVPTATPSLPETPDPAVGQQVWQQKPCTGCHGASAEGNLGPKLAGTGLTFDQVLLTVRSGAAPMPAFRADQVSDLELQHIYAWLRSLAPPTPTPAAAPSFPTGALKAMWQHVNDMKVKSDFAKDLPERLAADDAGRLGILKQYAAEAVQEGQAAIAQANQAISDIPNENVRAVIRHVIDEVNAVIGQANQALGQGSFGSAWPHAAEMVRISRLDAWPWATQAVRDAGLTGNVRVQVTDQAGNPIAGAFVTVLTAHTPVGVQADNAGLATISRVAAVPALQVKAYAAGLVYHEIHVNSPPARQGEAASPCPGPARVGRPQL